jgi:hypothetical protein
MGKVRKTQRNEEGRKEQRKSEGKNREYRKKRQEKKG